MHPFSKQAKTGQQTARARYADGGPVPKVTFAPEAAFGKNDSQNYRLDSRMPLSDNTDLNVRSRLSPNEAGPGKHGYSGMLGISHKF